MDEDDRLLALSMRLAQMEADQRAMGAALAGHSAWLDGHTDWIKTVEQGLGDLATGHTAQLKDMGRWLASTTQAVSALSSTPVISSPELQAIGPQAQRVDDRQGLARALKVWTVMRWLDQAPVESTVVISVIIPTRNRRTLLERAIASVLAQRHQSFQLVVVNDGSTDDTAAFLAAFDDTRLRVLHTTGVGASAARNLGLEAATGEIVTHLDDDNLMDPGWLRGVAWGFAQWPQTTMLYGARIIEDAATQGGVPSGAMPALEWLPFDRARLEQSNYIDMNTFAHRAGLAGAHFDPAVLATVEWETLLRLTAQQVPLELPVIACLYSSYAPDRLSRSATYLEETRRIRARVHTTRPMRVLSYNALFPLMSETYIEEEMLALEGQGAEVAFAAFASSVSPYPIRQPIYGGLDEGIASHNPDVIIVYWTSHALGELDHLTRMGRPFALRVHSFDFTADAVRQVMNHPACVGVWAFPHQAEAVPGVHTLVPIFTTHAAMPPPASHRPVVASISAGLPKKDWPLLFDVMDQLPELERALVLTRSNGFEDVPDEVVRLAARRTRPPVVTVNMPRAEVFELLSRTSVLLYTTVPGSPLGMPMSIIEGMCAGACIVTPDEPEMRALCGDSFRPYRTAADIVGHVHEVMAGGPGIAAEQRYNRDRALARFCAPELGVRFHAELSAAITAWRTARQLA